MYFLIYASTAARGFSEAELLSLLHEARTANARMEITGMLLYAPGQAGEKGTFVQVLEGPKLDVAVLYRSLRADQRHMDCTVIREGELFARRFGDWTMGFRDLATLDPAEVPGFSPIFFRNWNLRQVLAEPDPVLQLLYSFAGGRHG